MDNFQKGRIVKLKTGKCEFGCRLVVQPMTFSTSLSTQAKLATILCVPRALCLELLGLELLMDLFLPLVCKLLIGHKERCLSHLSTPNTQSRA